MDLFDVVVGTDIVDSVVTVIRDTESSETQGC